MGQLRQVRQPGFFAVIGILMLFLLTGCGIAQYVEEQLITIQEVVDEARVDLEQGSGIRALVKGEERQSLEKKGMKPETLNSSFELKQAFTSRPQAVHLLRTYQTGKGNSLTQEFYFVQNTIYQRTGASGWQKGKGQFGQLNLPYDPRYLLKSLAQDLHKGGVQMEVSGNDYVLTVDRRSSQTMVRPLIKEFLYSYEQLSDKKETPLREKDVRIDDFQQTIWIDKYTKRLRKLNMKVRLSADWKGQTFATEQKSELTIPGRFVKPITVPEAVKEEAI